MMLCQRGLSALTSCLHINHVCVTRLMPTYCMKILASPACFYGKLAESSPGSNKYKLVVVGGGSGGCAVAAKFSNLGQNCVIIEPSKLHYYQPLWTLVGAGLKGFQDSLKPMSEVLPKSCKWIRQRAVAFQPEENCVKLESGEVIQYEYLVVAMGIQLDYDKVKGLENALEDDPTVVTNYDPRWVNKTFAALQQFRGGNAIFTFPNTPIKCAGAPQKIMYLADEFFRKLGVRDRTNVMYNTALGVIFGVKKYAESLLKVVESRDIKVNYKHNLVEVDHKIGTATFMKLDDNTLSTFQYNFLHVTPPMSCPDVLKKSSLVNATGWVDVHKHTLQHTKFPNVFALGDCTSLPTSKTAAAVASQCGILHQNLSLVMSGRSSKPLYDGYTSCPLVTSSKSCILAEFDYDGNPLETFPFNQGKETEMAYNVKAHLLPKLYWKAMTRGKWNGPSTFRKIMHLGFSQKPKLTT